MKVRLVNFHCIVDIGDLMGNTTTTYDVYVTQIENGPSIYLAEFA
jgi:hypothetical protein